MMFRDLRYALRSLKKSPGLVAVAVVSLGLGLGLTNTMFSLLDALTHPYVPYKDADRLYQVRWWLSGVHKEIDRGQVYGAIRDQTRSFAVVLPVAGEDRQLQMGGEVGEIALARVPSRLFAVLGIRPELGRTLTDDDAGRDAVVVSDLLWRRWFAGRRSLEGATVTLDHQLFTVVGVMPPAMTFPFRAGAWVALPPDAGLAAARQAFWPLVKLKPGVTREAAGAELRAVAAQLTQLYHVEGAPFAFILEPLRDDPMRLSDIHYAEIGAALGVLLIACANLANLMLARGLAKRRELALRLAIGASRAAIIAQMFAECAVLTVAGAALGAILSLWGTDILASVVPRNLWWLGIVVPRLSWRVFAVGTAAAVGSAVIFGLVPAIRVAHAVSLDEPLKDGAGTTGRTRHRYSGLVIAEIALALALLMGAGLLLRVVHRLATYDFGFPARQLLQAFVVTPDGRDSTAGSRMAFQLASVAALRTVPGVAAAAGEKGVRPPGGSVTAEMTEESTRQLSIGYQAVTPEYLRTMDLPILDGRDFVDGDLGGNGVAILNAAAAARLYPHQRAVGRMLKLGGPMSRAPWVPIVGVCRIALTPQPGDLEAYHAEPEVYVVRATDAARDFRVVVRAAGDLRGLDARLAGKLQAIGPGAGRGVAPYLYSWRAAVQARTFLAQLFVTMGLFALVLAAVGLYGVLAYTVNRRLREFSVRMALGAQRADMLRLVFHDGLVMVLAGTGLGGFVALRASSLLYTFLEDVPPTDVVTLVASEVILIAVAIAACLAPALRAMRADPIEILRAT